MKTSISDYNEYKQVCLRASENNDVFNNFKKNSAYTTILEHASPQQGEAYLQYILKSDLNLSYIDKFKENDSQGGAVVSNYQCWICHQLG